MEYPVAAGEPAKPPIAPVLVTSQLTLHSLGLVKVAGGPATSPTVRNAMMRRALGELVL